MGVVYFFLFLGKRELFRFLNTTRLIYTAAETSLAPKFPSNRFQASRHIHFEAGHKMQLDWEYVSMKYAEKGTRGRFQIWVIFNASWIWHCPKNLCPDWVAEDFGHRGNSRARTRHSHTYGDKGLVWWRLERIEKVGHTANSPISASSIPSCSALGVARRLKPGIRFMMNKMMQVPPKE